MNDIVVGALGLTSTISSICFAYLAFKRNAYQDTEKEAKSEGALLSDIGYIKSSIDRMEKNLNRVDERYDNVVERLVKLEERIVGIEKYVDAITKEGD